MTPVGKKDYGQSREVQRGMTEKKERIYYWDNLKGLLILLVVLGHYVEYAMPLMPSLSRVWTAIYSFHMPAFVLVSGYFLGKSKRNPVERIPKVLGLYVLMQVLYAIRPFFYGKGVNVELAFPKYGCWFLLFLAYGYVLAYFLKIEKKQWIFAGTLAAALLIGFDTSVGREWGIGQSFYFMPYLIGGACFDVDKVIEWSKKHLWIGISGFLLLQAGMFFAQNFVWFHRKIFRGIENFGELAENPVAGAAGRAVGYMIAVLLVIFLLGFIPRKKTILSVIGRHTLIIYLTHTFMIKNLLPELERFTVLSCAARLGILTVFIAAACIIFCLAADYYGKAAYDKRMRK